MNNQWRWVPVEPTREQRNAVCMHPDLAHTLYCSMVSAAPEPPDKEEAEVIGYRVRYEQNPEAEYLMYQQPEGTYSSEPLILLSDHRFLVARLTAERDALQQRLNAADQRIDELERGEKAPLDPPQPITEQFIEDHLGKKPIADHGN